MFYESVAMSVACKEVLWVEHVQGNLVGGACAREILVEGVYDRSCEEVHCTLSSFEGAYMRVVP